MAVISLVALNERKESHHKSERGSMLFSSV